MRAAAERLQPGPGTGVGIVEAPEAGEVELFREAQHEADDAFDVALPVVMEPEHRTARAILQRQRKAREFRIVRGLVFLAQAQEEVERRDGLFRACPRPGRRRSV